MTSADALASYLFSTALLLLRSSSKLLALHTMPGCQNGASWLLGCCSLMHVIFLQPNILKAETPCMNRGVMLYYLCLGAVRLRYKVSSLPHQHNKATCITIADA
jgi:hypothetical protein